MIESEGGDTIAAVIAEPVIGAGGIIPPPPDYFPLLREICDRHGILLILDEVVTGFGRTGTMFGFEQWGVRPDIVTLAKGITSGYLPLGASMVSDHVWSTIAEGLPGPMPFNHGFTYSGHPTCCAAALANIAIIEREDLPGNAARMGAYLMERLRELERFASVGEVRGMGLMIGIELVADKATKRGFTMPHTACTRVEHEAWERGLYCRALGIEVVGIAPPLDLDRATADRIVEILADVDRGDGARADAGRACTQRADRAWPGRLGRGVLLPHAAGALRPRPGRRRRSRGPVRARRAGRRLLDRPRPGARARGATAGRRGDRCALHDPCDRRGLPA